MKICNLYAGVGGNRKYWDKEHTGLDLEITAVENNPKIAKIYQDFFPKDEMIIGDAHDYLLKYFKLYDFIWSSPPCPTHSVCNNFLHAQGYVRYPDMSLWQEIVFLKRYFYGKWVVENVKSYYPPLWPPIELDRHYFWTNFLIRKFKSDRKFNIANARTTTRQDGKDYDRALEKYHGFTLPKEFKQKRLALRNCVYPPLGLHILNESQRDIQPELFR